MKLTSRLSVSLLVVAVSVGCSRNSQPTLTSPVSSTQWMSGAGGTAEVADITVNTLEDIADLAGLQRVNDLPGPDGVVSFREAVTAANNTTGPQTIAFAIPPASFWLMPEMGLLKLEQGPFFLNDDGTTVDFSTQTANNGNTNSGGPEIGIYGLEPNGWGVAAIYVNGDNCVIKGLGNVYQRGYAVRIVGNQNRVIGCQISGPLHAAIGIEGYMGGPTPSDNIVGGTAPGEGNFLSSVRIAGPAERNLVIGNTVLGGGVLVQGAPQYGVVARSNRVGGPTPAERNVISGAGKYGEEGYPVGAQVSVLDADDTIVEGNYIGTTVDGMRAYSPQIGQHGIEVRDSRHTAIRGNLIAGERVVGTNHYAGKIFGQAIYVSATNFDTQDVAIEDNTIGVAVDGTQVLTRTGIVIASMTTLHRVSGVVIDSNHIARIETTGIHLGSQESGVRITRNSVHDCGALGIDLIAATGSSGPTPNDAGDGDIGANGLQNFPLLQAAATTGSKVTIHGLLASTPSTQFTIEFFASPTCDPSGFGEGAAYVGATVVTTDGTGTTSFVVSMPASVSAGAKMTATATRVSTGDTSEFGACVSATVDTHRASRRVVAIRNQ